MKELVIGASGLLGSYLFKEGRMFGTYTHNQLPCLIRCDATDLVALERLIERIKPDIIYFPAANPHVDWVEVHPEEAKVINVDSPLGLIRVIRGRGIKLVYFSSDYVFAGSSGPYGEEDSPSPLNEYGKQKYFVEQQIEQYLKNYLIFRITNLYGFEKRGKNFAQNLICQLRVKKSVRVAKDQMSTPTYVPDLARAIREIAVRDYTGVFHLAASDYLSRYEFALGIADIFGLERELIVGVSTSELEQQAARPLQGGLISFKAEKLLNRSLLGVNEGLSEMLLEEKRYGRIC